MSRQICFVFALFMISFLLLDQVHSAPHHNKKHAACQYRLFKTLNTLCNKMGDLETIKATAARCCKENCDLTEMYSACTLNPNNGSDESTESY
ncbi:hypothetical protein GCK72_006066 [Caenorhabditis remanei]|uniref:Uncharacterized protein n=1 Tax=Caenorhabditis remanei TaxID=31234 RepID=A0A6A5HE91_CAERE|nr:hypothetical protein GCK72_006066 [Caenorhabditis remanei]KAF1766110.1 hypothetical protein GCK72_006066 [Caenorhabditis remanei]